MLKLGYGKEVIPAKFYDNWGSAYGFYYGYTQCCKTVEGEIKWGFIDHSGDFAIPAIFDKVESFQPLNAEIGCYDGYGDDYGMKLTVKVNLKDVYESGSLERFIDIALPRDKAVPSINDVKKAEVIDIDKEIESELRKWAQKDEFETTEQWRRRTSESARVEMISELTRHWDEITKAEEDRRNKDEQRYMKMRQSHQEELSRIYHEILAKRFKEEEMKLIPYDADRERFIIVTAQNEEFQIDVPLAVARSFKYRWDTIRQTAKPIFTEENGKTVLSRIQFADGEHIFVATYLISR